MNPQAKGNTLVGCSTVAHNEIGIVSQEILVTYGILVKVREFRKRRPLGD